MIHFKTAKGTFIVPPIPSDAYDFEIEGNKLIFSMISTGDNSRWYDQEPLAAGNYTLIGQVKDLTEEQWREVVDETTEIGTGLFVNYYPQNNRLLLTATESGLSLCTAHGIQQHDVVVRVG